MGLAVLSGFDPDPGWAVGGPIVAHTVMAIRIAAKA